MAQSRSASVWALARHIARWLRDEEASGSARAACHNAITACRCTAELSRTGNQGGAAMRRRWPGVSAARFRGRPARRTPGRSRVGPPDQHGSSDLPERPAFQNLPALVTVSRQARVKPGHVATGQAPAGPGGAGLTMTTWSQMTMEIRP